MYRHKVASSARQAAPSLALAFQPLPVRRVVGKQTPASQRKACPELVEASPHSPTGSSRPRPPPPSHSRGSFDTSRFSKEFAPSCTAPYLRPAWPHLAGHIRRPHDRGHCGRTSAGEAGRQLDCHTGCRRKASIRTLACRRQALCRHRQAQRPPRSHWAAASITARWPMRRVRGAMETTAKARRSDPMSPAAHGCGATGACHQSQRSSATVCRSRRTFEARCRRWVEHSSHVPKLTRWRPMSGR
jgi:hypothetical protein